MRKTFHARFASRADRSGGALRAEARGLESALEAARRLKITLPAMRAASAAAETNAAEWHHVRVRGEAAAELDYRPADEWDGLAASAREIAGAARRGKISREKFCAECAARGLVAAPNGGDMIQGLRGGVVRASWRGNRIGVADFFDDWK